MSKFCSYYTVCQGPAELPADWNKTPHGPDEIKLDQRQVRIVLIPYNVCRIARFSTGCRKTKTKPAANQLHYSANLKTW